MIEQAVAETPRRGADAPASVKYEDILDDLQRQRAELLRDASRSLTDGMEVEAHPDLNDQATAEIDQHCAMALKEHGRARLMQIDEALDRMASGRYGICEECEEEIPYRRLKARPMSTLCVPCKTRQEEDEKIRQ
ncbi:MAG TPA: TraR/DksA family transcriptional regulator [Nitrospirales bacterium]|nr:TraR/DksA family transcriptional regulator [Nitrospirales bacterium]